MLGVALLGAAALGLWIAGVGQSTSDPVPLGVRPDSAYWKAARTCRRIFPGVADQRRCSQLALHPNSSTLLAGSAPSFKNAAQQGMYELIGWHPNGDGSGTFNTNGSNVVSWNYNSGLWAGPELSHWWQSAMALRTMVRYLERTGTTSPYYQQVLLRTYRLEVHHPLAIASSYFVNRFGDDTAWWGLAWVEAANYELHYLHDLSAARTFLSTAEYDAHYLERLKKSCGGIVWKQGFPSDLITNAEFTSLAAELYSFRAVPGPFRDEVKADAWLHDARADLHWIRQSGLVNMRKGRVSDRLTRSCKRIGGPLTYTQGEMAEALIQMGNALHRPAYYRQALQLLNFATKIGGPSHMVTRSGIMQQPCESKPSLCVPERDRGRLSGTPTETWLDQLSYKGILAQAIDDYVSATGSHHFKAFMRHQASAIVNNAIRDPKGRPGDCGSPSTCQFVFYWAWPLNPRRPMIANTATEMSAIDVLTGVLPVRTGGRPLGPATHS
ncbi:MAG TPA: glycoside hydrolase family 76 protein [Solirubrobacteraceae bacterium]|nr:glycoside hydrolase family 76 protein [Solirubrobacteraceae bacterium]